MTSQGSENLQNGQRLHAVISGRVQGVGFRAFVLDHASALALQGWCRNIGWDKVEVVAEGSRAALDSLIEDIRRGPGMAAVECVDIEWIPATGEFTGFRVC